MKHIRSFFKFKSPYSKFKSQLLIFLFFVTVLSYSYIKNANSNSKIVNKKDVIIKSNAEINDNIQKGFIIDFTANRISSIFNILKQKEETYGDVLEQLDLISFKDLISTGSSIHYPNEVNEYLTVENKQIKPNRKFINYLNNKSTFHSFAKPRSNVVLKKIQVGLNFGFELFFYYN